MRLQKKRRLEKQQAAFSRLDNDEDVPPSPAARPTAAGARPAAAGAARAPSKSGVSRLPPRKVLPAGKAKLPGRTMLMINFPEVRAPDGHQLCSPGVFRISHFNSLS